MSILHLRMDTLRSVAELVDSVDLVETFQHSSQTESARTGHR